jgi:hypothetical protein
MNKEEKIKKKPSSHKYIPSPSVSHKERGRERERERRLLSPKAAHKRTQQNDSSRPKRK